MAAQLEAHALRDIEAVPIAPKELADWARENGVDLRVSGDRLALVNAKRAALWLPPFRVINPAVEQIYAAPKMPLIAATEAELLEMVRTLSATRIGLMTPPCAGWCSKLARSGPQPDRSSVQRFCMIIRDGLWRNTAEPIVFSQDGWLNDGRVRLAAIVETGIAVELDVRFGVDPRAYEATNTGATRKAADALHILGAHHSLAQAALARLLHLYDEGKLGMRGARVVETSHIIKTIEATPSIPPIAEFMANSSFAPTRTAPFGVALVAGARLSSIERAIAFGNAVVAGRDDDGSPTRALHIKLRDQRMKKAGKFNPVETAAMTARAWNGWATGRPFSLRVQPADLAPGGFPRIVAPREGR